MLNIFIVATFFFWIISLIGLGFGFNYFIKKYLKQLEVKKEIRILYFGVLGLIFVSIFGTLFNFFLPVGMFFSCTILFLGLVLAYSNRSKIVHDFRWYDLIIIVILIIFSGIFPFMNLLNYDTGLYHQASINWIINSALPFGLANLHDRLGFNSYWFMNSAIIQPLRFITVKPFYIINAILSFFYGSFVLLTFANVLKEKCISLSSIFAIGTFIPWFFCLANFNSSPSPDVPVMLLTFFVSFLIIKTFEERVSDYLFVSVVLSFYLITLKLSAMPYFLGLLIMMLLLIIKKVRKLWFNDLCTYKYVFTLVSLSIIGIPYFLKGLISSGYLVFPSTFLNFNLKWAVPVETANNTAKWVKCWPKKQDIDCFSALDNWGWFNPWINKHIASEGIIIGMFLLGILLILLVVIFKKLEKGLSFTVVFCLALIGCIFWFFLAPEPRFGYGYLYSLVIILISYGIYNLFRKTRLFYSVGYVIFFICLFLLIYQININFNEVREIKNSEVKYIEKKTNSGDIIIIPEVGDQCFDGPLLCTPYFKEDMKIFYGSNDIPRMFIIKR
jgi:hypothetical protein